jgi:hypothetical protein
MVYHNLLKIPTQMGKTRGRRPDPSGLIALYDFLLKLSRIRSCGYCSLTNRELADALGVSAHTVTGYLRRLRALECLTAEYFLREDGGLGERRLSPQVSLEDLEGMFGVGGAQ